MSNTMRVLVTGAAGFIGNHLIPKLVDKGHDVYGLDICSTGYYKSGLSREGRTIFGDLRETHWVKRIIREVCPNVVIHLAGISPVSYSYTHPQEVIETNLMGTINLAEACLTQEDDFKQFLFASTSETYGNGPNPKTEETAQNPNSPYAISKVTSEKYLLYMLSAYGFPTTILRNFNTYGRKNDSNYVVERIISQMLKRETVRLGDPDPIRDLEFIDDHVNSYLSCVDNPKAVGQVFNFCTGIGTSIRQLAGMIAELTSFQGEIVWKTTPKRPMDVKMIVGDFRKAEHILGWKPKFTLEEGIKTTVEFWRNNLALEIPVSN